MTLRAEPGACPALLVFMPHFAPGFKIGGPLQSILGLIAFHSENLSIRVLTLNRDYTDRQAYPDIPTGRWLAVSTAQVRYCASAWQALRALRGACQGRTLYLQSSFSPGWSLLPLLLARLRLIRPRHIVVAPRGELSAGALALRPAKKRLALAAMRLLALHRGVRFQATCEEEVDEIASRLHVARDRIMLLRNLPMSRPDAMHSMHEKVPGVLRMVFLSRVSPKKNLHRLIQDMAQLPAGVTLDVYGPADDQPYLAQCQALAAALGQPERVRFVGAVAPARVGATLQGYDVFALPTMGENFGHAIYEALANGLPVILSDRTPWRNLRDRMAGEDLDLEAPDALRAALQRFADMDTRTILRYRQGAQAIARQYIEQAVDAGACARLFGPGHPGDEA
ncbi:transferase [Bordetella ansorpii]|uniref:Transferase n=1 Tax=Bordetella ansorpii TaxID=288768 RepID=A0A157SVC4_9BORD|nr:glycosyltransferase family 4 protein [Bordetella ansorpii]SAI73876.1 transferase [Bordetella ansorpii]